MVSSISFVPEDNVNYGTKIEVASITKCFRNYWMVNLVKFEAISIKNVSEIIGKLI